MKQSAAAVALRDEALREANRVHCRQTRERKRNQERLLREEVELLQLCRSIVESGPDLFSVHGLTPDAPFSFLSQSFWDRLQIEPDAILGQPLSTIVDPRDVPAFQNAVLHVLSGGGGGWGGAPTAADNNDGAGGGFSSSSSWSPAASTALDSSLDLAHAATHRRHQQPAAPSATAIDSWPGLSGSPSFSSWSTVASPSLDPSFGGAAASAVHQQQPAAAAAHGVPAGSNGGGGRGSEACVVNVRLAGFGLSCCAGMSLAVGNQGLIVVTRLYLP